MLGLPPTTEVKRPLPKAQLFKRFDWTPSQRERFDDDVSRLDFVNWISPRTVPAIAIGNEVKEIFVVEVSLKSRDFDTKTITLLAKYIPQRIVYLLRYEDEAMLAVYHTKLFITGWQLLTPNSSFLTINGLNLDAVWVNIVNSIRSEQLKVNTNVTKLRRIGDCLGEAMVVVNPRRQPGDQQDMQTLASERRFCVDSYFSDIKVNTSPLTDLTEQIKIDEDRAKLERQIAALERQMNATKQPRRKRELFVELQKLKTSWKWKDYE